MISDPVLDGRRVEALVQELFRYAPHYTPELNLADEQSAAPALMRVFSHLAETILVRIGRTPHKHFVAFLDSLGISLLPARPASAPVTFRLAPGLTEVVPVPAGTRVTAAGVDDDIPFETTGELMAIPGLLTAAYGADPLADVIYPPPPGFLAQDIRTPTELVYRVQAFAAQGTTRLQLDHGTELAAASFVRLNCKDKVVVEKVDDGNIIVLEAPLARDVTAGSILTPIRNFEVFDGIDRQEHVLYLGDSDLFTVKEPARITLTFTLVEATGLAPLDIVWQFWTKDDEAPADSPDKEEHWHDFGVESDGTAGLSASGSIVLEKSNPLQIKEREVGGRTSRWIRGSLRQKLAAEGPALPEVDTIAASVKSGGTSATDEGIAADQGFHNTTPLDMQVQPSVGFFPFGTEPRQFDAFYIASKEAFSKREAQATLDFALDLQTLAAPALVETNVGLRAYSIGLRRRLYELDIATGTFEILGSPTDTPAGAGYSPREDSVPSTIATSDLIYTFVVTEDAFAADPANVANKIWIQFHRSDGTSKSWTDLDAPAAATGAKQAKFNPAALLVPGGSPFARVFVVGGDGKLYSRDVSSTPATVTLVWDEYNSPTGQPFVSSPFVAVNGSDILVFVNGSDGFVHRLTHSGGVATWTTLTPNNQSFRGVSRPFAQAFGAPTEAKVFVFGREAVTEEWKLFECDTRTVDINGEFEWNDLGRPTANPVIAESREAPDPVGFIEDPAAAHIDDEGKHIFLRGADNRLYERLDEETTLGAGAWELRTREGDPTLRDSPAVFVDPGTPTTAVHVASASGRNSLVTWGFDIVSGTVAANARGQAVLLDEASASETDGEYDTQTITITDGAANEDREVIAYEGARRLARLDLPALPFVPDSSFDCLFGAEDVGPARDESQDLFALHAPAADARVARSIYVRVDGDFALADFYSRLTGVVSFGPADHPSTGDAFVVYAEVMPVRTEFLSTDDTTTIPALSWEYWNGRGWLSLTVIDGTRNLLTSGKVSFVIPKSIQSTEVAGQENFWIRARLVGGDYGRETFKIVKDAVVSEKSTLRPPKVSTLRIFYVSPPVPPGVCLSFNNLDYLDQTAASQLGGAHFRPFERLEQFANRSLTLFLGFDQPFKTGPIRMLVDAAEREYDTDRPPEFDWQFRKDRLWKALDVEDGTVALMRQGILTLSASDELTRETRFGQSLFWIRGSLRTDRGSSGADYPLPLLRGVFLNTVMALQGETLTGEIVGSSDGEPNQTLRFQHADVLAGEDLRIREVLSTEEREQIEREQGKDSVVDREDIGGTWVRWRETLALFDAGPRDPCYLIDRAAGLVIFGDGTHGKIPAAGVDNIRAFTYRTGGGAVGNVEAGAIASLGTAVAGIESVFNPTPAGGGSDKATTDAMLTIGPRRISHHDRAVSTEDFEELALEASRQVAKVRCLSATNLTRRGAGRPDPCDRSQRHQAMPALGWVSLIVVPDSPDARPCPSLELRRSVRDFLLRRAPSILASSGRIVVRPPDYVEVAVEAEIFVTSLERAAAAETLARTTLETLLHPLRGGPDGTGWEFGRPIWKSDVFSALERIDEIDRVENLRFHFRGGTDPDRVVIGPNELLASGQHLLAIRKA